MVKVACVVVNPVLAAMTRTRTLCPSVTLPAASVNTASSIEYSPPIIEIGVDVFIPLIVMASEVIKAPGATSCRVTKLNRLGEVSAGVLLELLLLASELLATELLVSALLASLLLISELLATELAGAELVLLEEIGLLDTEELLSVELALLT